MSVTPIRSPWKSKMTGRERFLNQMHYRPIDRTFNMEFGYWHENFELWRLFKDNGIDSNEKADEFFAFDRIETVYSCNFMHPAFADEIIEETPTKIIRRNSEGLLAEVPKDGQSTIPHYIKSSITTPEDWKKVKEERFALSDPARIIDVESLKKAHPENRDYPLGVYCGSMIGRVRDMLTFEGLAYACYDYPEMVEDMVETCCQLVELSLDQLLPCLKFDFASGWEDIAFKNGPIVSVDFFEQVVVPRYKRIGLKLREAGIDIWFTDCDGDVRPLLKGFLESGINCLFPYEVNSCIHPGKLLDQYEGELRIMGGFDKLEMIKGRDAIKKYMESLVPYVERGGYIPFCDHRCPPDVNENDYLYYLDLKEQMFGLKT